MRTLRVDEATYEALREHAAARGLSIEAWLKEKLESLRSVETEAATQLERLRDFDAQLEGYGGRAELSREDLYE